MPRLLQALFAHGWVVVGACALAQEAPPASAPAAETPTADTKPPRLRGLFEIDLPRFDPPGTFSLHLNPRFRDLLNRDYLRIPTGVRWTLDELTELELETEAYLTHGLKDSAGNGLGELRFGARRLIRRWPQPRFDTSFGVNLEFPVGNPPLDMTDGLNHVKPYFVTEYRPPAHPRLTHFAGLTLDFVSDSPVDGLIGPNTPEDDSVALTGGVVYTRTPLVWTLQATYTTTLLSGRDEHFFTLNPSVLWFVPRRYTLISRTQWMIGFGLRSTWGPDGHDFSTSTRVRAEITLRQALQRLRDATDRKR